MCSGRPTPPVPVGGPCLGEHGGAVGDGHGLPGPGELDGSAVAEELVAGGHARAAGADGTAVTAVCSSPGKPRFAAKEALPADLVYLLIHRAGLAEETVARLQRYWTEGN